jgi:hypothetical protein
MRTPIVATAFLLLAGCAQTEQAKVSEIKESGFLRNYSQLTPTSDSKLVALRYIDTSAPWSRYSKVRLEPVTYWAGADTTVPTPVQQALTDYAHQKIGEQLTAKGFQLVDTPGPDVLVVRAALEDATAATPVLRTISVVVPQARILNLAQKQLTGNYAFAGSLQTEGEVTDSLSGKRLAAWVDQREGAMSIKNANVWKWGDAENSINYWAAAIADRASELRGGTAAFK